MDDDQRTEDQAPDAPEGGTVTEPLDPAEAAESTRMEGEQKPSPASGGSDPSQPRSTSAAPPEAQSGIPDIPENADLKREGAEDDDDGDPDDDDEGGDDGSE